jgi:hypothetical protein
VTATLYLGSHHATTRWWALGVPLCVSYRVMRERRRLPEAQAPWILDSGAFTELRLHGRFTFTSEQYADDAERLALGLGRCRWVAPMDYMCEPFMVARTGLSVAEHQRRTVANFIVLRELLGPLVVPVLQGYAPREYDRCVGLYQDAGIDLAAEPVVGLGSVCRRSNTSEIRRLIHYLSDHRLRLHGFGLKGATFRALRGLLVSADSMAWSYAARREGRDSNSPAEAMRWRARLVS